MNTWRAILIVGVVCAILAGAYVFSLHIRPVPGPFDGAKVIVLPLDGCTVRGMSPNGTLALACAGGRPATWSQAQGLHRLPELPNTWYLSELGVTDSGLVWGSYTTAGPDVTRYSFTWSKAEGLQTTKYHDTSVVIHAVNAEGTEFRGHTVQDGVRRPCSVDTEGVIYPLNLTNLPAEGMDVRFVSDDLDVMLGIARVKNGVQLLRVSSGHCQLVCDVKSQRPSLTPTAMSRNGRFFVALLEREVAIWSDGRRSEIDCTEVLRSAPKSTTPSSTLVATNVRFRAISEDGALMVGSTGYGFSFGEPVFWTEKEGVQFLLPHLNGLGIKTSQDGYTIGTPECMSRDSRIIAGDAHGQSGRRPYIIVRR